jgi:hypothetical protein
MERHWRLFSEYEMVEVSINYSSPFSASSRMCGASLPFHQMSSCYGA